MESRLHYGLSWLRRVKEEYGLKVTAISVITNVYGKTVDLGHEGVVEAAKLASRKLVKLLDLE